MPRRPALLLFLVPVLTAGAVGIGGCRRAPAGESAAAPRTRVAPAADSQPALVIPTPAPVRAPYTPPADGRLTERQVEMYIAVGEKRREIREQALARAGRPPGERPTERVDLLATVRAIEKEEEAATAPRIARELGYDPGEYAWVEARVTEARMAAAERAMEERLATGRRQYLALLEEQKRHAGDDVQRADLDGQIADFRRRTFRAAPRTPQSVQQNAQLLERYRERLEGTERPLAGTGRDAWNRR